MALNPALGMRGTGTFDVTGERPESYREGILFLYPNGDAPLTAIMAKLRSQKVDDAHFHWFTKKFEIKRADISANAIYNDQALSSPYTGSGVKDQVVYVKCTANFANFCRVGHMVQIRVTADHSADVIGRVTDVQRTGVDATSWVAVKLLEADDNSSNGNDMRNADSLAIVGNINAEGAARSESITFKVTEHSNYTQIFRTPLSITRTAMRTKLRTGDAYKEMKREALEIHSCEMEDAFIWGKKTLETGDNGQPMRTTQGIVDFVRTNAPQNVLDFKYDATYSATTWDESGKAFMDNAMKTIFKYGKRERIALVGDGALLGIQNMVEANTMYNISMGEIGYGIQVTKLKTVFGTLNLILAPRFAIDDSNSHSMLVIDTNNLTFNYIDDTFFKKDESDRKGGGAGYDGKNEEFITEAGLEIHHPETHAYITGVGEDSLV